MKLKKLKAMKNKPINIVIGARHSGKNQNLYFSLCLDMQDQITYLNEQLAIINKALKLACKNFIRDEVGMLTDTELYNYFIKQAKEAIKK